MRDVTKLRYCLVANAMVMLLVITLVCTLGNGGKYWRWGPQSDLILVNVVIDNWSIYGIALFIIAIVKCSTVVINELGSPILGFSIYNPDKKHITNFTKNELQFYANAMWMTNSIRGIFMVLVGITQIDLALWGVFISEIASMFTIRSILNGKTFGPKQEQDDQGYDKDYVLMQEIVTI